MRQLISCLHRPNNAGDDQVSVARDCKKTTLVVPCSRSIDRLHRAKCPCLFILKETLYIYIVLFFIIYLPQQVFLLLKERKSYRLGRAGNLVRHGRARAIRFTVSIALAVFAASRFEKKRLNRHVDVD